MRKEDIQHNLLQDFSKAIQNHFQDAFVEAMNTVPSTSADHRTEQCMLILEAQKKYFKETFKQDVQRLAAVLKK